VIENESWNVVVMNLENNGVPSLSLTMTHFFFGVWYHVLQDVFVISIAYVWNAHGLEDGSSLEKVAIGKRRGKRCDDTTIICAKYPKIQGG
jgi:hypothetical protein